MSVFYVIEKIEGLGFVKEYKEGLGFVKGCRIEEFVVVGWVCCNFIDLNCVCIFKIGNMYCLKFIIDYVLFFFEV